MIDISRILCPVDFSDQSRHALAHAAAIAQWYGSTITVLYVHPVVPIAAYAPGAPAFPPYVVTAGDRDKLLASMKQFAEGEVSSGVALAFEVVEGSAVPEIFNRAAAIRSDLIVLGTHGRSGFDRLMLGSVTEKVLRKAACPVLSVPPKVHDGESARPVFKTILSAVDFSDSSLHALQYSMALAQEADARLTVLHVIELPADAHEQLPHLSPGVREYVNSVESDRGERLRALVPDRVRAYCNVETMITTGKPYREVLRIAGEQGANLIVMGIRGRGAADLLFFGSTAQHVVREATCPVLTLRK